MERPVALEPEMVRDFVANAHGDLGVSQNYWSRNQR